MGPPGPGLHTQDHIPSKALSPRLSHSLRSWKWGGVENCPVAASEGRHRGQFRNIPALHGAVGLIQRRRLCGCITWLGAAPQPLQPGVAAQRAVSLTLSFSLSWYQSHSNKHQNSWDSERDPLRPVMLF